MAQGFNRFSVELSVLFQDDDILVVDKPSDLLSVPGRGPEKADCAVSRAAGDYGWIRECHRLDQPTSGLMILARNPEAHRIISSAFADGRVEKTYIAIVAALPQDTERPGVNCSGGRMVVHQRLDTDNRPVQIVDADKGRRALTEWRVADMPSSEPYESFYRLELRPLTGRTHQLRLTLAVCGAPILGDNLYAPPEIQRIAPRLMLHAASLRFPHPRSGEEVGVSLLPEF